MDPYPDSVAHLTDELKRVDLLIRRALTISRGPHSKIEDAFRGLVISEPEIDAMLDAGEFLSQYWRRQDAAKAALSPLDQKLRALRETIDQRRELASKSALRLTLPYLAQRFGLSPAEVDLLLIAIAPELESRYETLYAYLQDDVTRKRPSVDLALNLTCRSEREKLFARRFFEPGSPLVHFEMLELLEDPHDRQPTLLRKFLKIEDWLLCWLIETPSANLPLGSLVEPYDTLETLEVDDATRGKLQNLADSLQLSGTSRHIVHITGSSPDELQSAAQSVANALGKPLLRLQVSELEGSKANLNILIRNCVLLDAGLAAFSSESTPAQPDLWPASTSHQLPWRLLDQLPGPLFLLGPVGAFPNLPPDAQVWRLELPPPDYELRRNAWKAALPALNGDTPARLAEAFRFGGAQIRQACNVAASVAALRDPSNSSLTVGDILQAGRSMTAPSLQRYAIALQPRYTWSDIVLPEDKMQQLRHIASRFQHRGTVNRDWGFGEKLSRGKGLNILFTGLSGAGKTMAAEVLANALSLVLYQIDLSTVVSKYIGETDKNLSAIFREAELSQSLLFFDEADSLFGKRAEVKDAHDRYSNLEVNYLLQRIEQFEGIVVLATNLQRNIDDAFLRRMQEVIDFPMPDEALRERIWRKHMPSTAPVGRDIDFAFLARQFKLTGGNIKNAVMSAAYLAAGESKKIGMDEMIRGVRMELEKQGKLVMKADFGKHFAAAQTVPQSKEN